MAGDTLNDQELAQKYQFAYDLITSIPELYEVFRQASDAKKGVWSPAKFQAAVKNLDWYKNNDTFVRRAWEQQTANGGNSADWQDQISAATEAIKARAAQLGVKVSDADLPRLAKDYLYGGWMDGARARELDKALGGEKVKEAGLGTSTEGTFATELTGGGIAGQTANNLRQLAAKNGVAFNDDWFDSVGRSVAMGLSTAEEWQQDVYDKAASLYPVYADKIRQGVDVSALASPYMQTMAQTLELDPNSIKLDDDFISQALNGQVDAKGNPQPQSLYDFKMQLRKDPRWASTQQASDKAGQVTSTILRMFGMGG